MGSQQANPRATRVTVTWRDPPRAALRTEPGIVGDVYQTGHAVGHPSRSYTPTFNNQHFDSLVHARPPPPRVGTFSVNMPEDSSARRCSARKHLAVFWATDYGPQGSWTTRLSSGIVHWRVHPHLPAKRSTGHEPRLLGTALWTPPAPSDSPSASPNPSPSWSPSSGPTQGCMWHGGGCPTTQWR